VNTMSDLEKCLITIAHIAENTDRQTWARLQHQIARSIRNELNKLGSPPGGKFIKFPAEHGAEMADVVNN